MNNEPHPEADVQLEQLLGNLLRVGVVLAAVVVLAGGIVYLVRHAEEPSDYRVFQDQTSQLHELEGIVTLALAGRGRGIIQLGLLLLIATPVARVVFSVFGFAREKDWLYVGLTLFVLGVLMYSLFFARF